MHSGFRVIWDSHVRGFQISFVRVFWVVFPKESDMNFPRAFAAISCVFVFVGIDATAIAQEGDVQIVAAWGYNGNGQCNIPSDLGVCTQIAGGGEHTIAIQQSGIVRTWGYNLYGQCNIPSDLGVCTQIAAGGYHTIAIQQSGTVRAWGYNVYGQCYIPSNLGLCTKLATGGGHSIALFPPTVLNTRTYEYFSQLTSGILNAENGDTLLVEPSTLAAGNVDFRGKSIELKSKHAILRPAISTTLFANGARMTAPESIKIDGVVNIPTNVGITITTSSTLAFAGNTFVSLGGSVMAQNDGSPVQLDGSMILATNAVFNALAPISLNGSLDLLGGILIADNFSTASESTFVSVGGTIDVGLLTMGGDASCLASTIVADVAVSASSQLAASGQIIGAIDNSGRILTTDDLVVIGNIHNKTNGTILAQVGVLYVTGQLMNEGIVIGNVITTPGFAGGGTGGTQPGDGIRVAGSVSVGTGGELRFIEELWKFSLCGDMTIACPASKIQFQGAELSFDGCDSTTQSFEVTSRDFGCVAGPFEGGAADVSLFGEIAIHTGSTVALVDAFHNTAGKGSEVLYAKGLHVFPGATLMTNGHKVYTSNANIQGSVDDPSNICELPYNPNPDINGDGYVNGIDLAYILVYWSTGTAVADLNRDGIVSGLDLAIMMGAWQP